MSRCLSLPTALALCLSATALTAQTPDSSLVTLDRIFDSDEFAPEPLGGVRWIDGRGGLHQARARQRDAARPGAGPLRRGQRRAARCGFPPARLVPAGDSLPLVVEDYTVSPDRKRLLLFTNSRKVWRQNTRGDFWTLDLATWRLRKLGGPAAAPSTLMFAKFSPDGGRVAYVREHDLYVERPRRRPHHPAHAATAPAPSSTAPSTGSTRRSSTCATGSAGARTAGASPSGSSTPRACATST